MLVKSFTFILSLVYLCADTPPRPVSTYSIVALDTETGQLGVAVQSHWFSVGTVVPWAKAGVGAVATQWPWAAPCSALTGTQCSIPISAI